MSLPNLFIEWTTAAGAPTANIPATSASLTAQSDAQGAYHFDTVRPGHYAVTFTLPAFVTVRREVACSVSETRCGAHIASWVLP
jgi:protocatechuate 3,4-dioxygenase beta subunit